MTRYPWLRERHLDVLAAAAVGMTAEETAFKLWLSPWTVKEYRQAALRALDARNVTEAVVICIRAGLINLDDPMRGRAEKHHGRVAETALAVFAPSATTAGDRGPVSVPWGVGHAHARKSHA